MTCNNKQSSVVKEKKYDKSIFENTTSFRKRKYGQA